MSRPQPNPEKSQFWPQKSAARFQQVKSQILARPELFANQGSIVATWRKHGDTRLGPYFRLRYCDNGVRRSIYLGQCEDLVQQIRVLLAHLQFRRTARRLRAEIRKSLRIQMNRLKTHLRANGYYMKGSEIRKPRKPLTPDPRTLNPPP